MFCLNCNRELQENQKRCPDCGEKVDPEAFKELEVIAAEILQHLDPNVLADFKKAVMESETADDFVNALMIGDCPKCSSTNLVSCEQDPDIDNPCIAHCFDCGVYWCTECRKLLSAKEYDTHHDTCPEMEYLEPPDDFPEDLLA